MHDRDYMKLALRLARRGLGRTSPNPMVGAVIVKDGRIIGQGYHRFFGGKHAEINALENATEDVRGATMYVTLEPCRHWGKTPPCVDAIIKSGIGRVAIGTLDPNPSMSGKSVALLKEPGIQTLVGMLEAECRTLNEAHFKLMTTGLPLVRLKFAQTLDGRIATSTGDSRWLSSPQAQRYAHRLRSRHDGVLVGAGTVLADDPELTVRLVRGRNPSRIILDAKLRTPLEAKVLKNQKAAPTLIATTSKADGPKLAAIKRKGIEVLTLAEDEHGEVDLSELLRILGQRGISSLLVEGGAAVITSFLRRHLADRLTAIITPKVMGKGLETVGELNITEVNKTIRLSFEKVRRVGEDIVIEAKVMY